MIRTEIVGVEQLKKNFESLVKKTQTKIIREAARAAGNKFLAAAKAKAPVRTGAIRKTLKLRVSKYQKRGTVQLLVMPGTRAELGIPASSPWYYPAHIEFGATIGGNGKKVWKPLNEEAADQLMKVGSIRPLAKDLTFVKRTNGMPLLVKVESSGAWTPMFGLVDKFEIKARPYMRPAFDENKTSANALAQNMIKSGIEREAAALAASSGASGGASGGGGK